MKVEIIFKPQLQSNNEKVRNIRTFSGITSVDLEYDNNWYLILNTGFCVTEYKRMDDLIERIHITD